MADATGADAVVIGAGISGLVGAILLAETGRRVIVLEQHRIPGGYLQQFRRKHTVFDVGFHYMGSTAPGRPMRQFLEHLRVWDRLTVRPFPAAAAIVVRSGGRSFGYPTRFAAFAEQARRTWPHETLAIDRLVAEVDDVCRAFRWFDLRKGRDYAHPLDLPFGPESLATWLDPRVSDPWLRRVLEFQTFNLGLFPAEIPWVKHVLAFRSNFDETCRIDGGGGALVDALVLRGRELGVRYRFQEDVTEFRCDGRRLVEVATAAGNAYQADLFVAACPPKVVLKRIRDEDVSPLFKDRVLAMKDSRGAMQVFCRLRAPLDSLDASCVLLEDPAEATGDPPLHALLVTYPTAAETKDRGGPRLEAMTYLDDLPFAKWRGTRTLRRGDDYDRLKDDLARRMIAMIAKVCPELPDRLADVYTATPLTDAWYTRNSAGGVFGISHDVTQQGLHRPQPRTRLKNLWFTGHSIQMPGICGVFINAFHTGEQIRGDDLFGQVAV